MKQPTRFRLEGEQVRNLILRDMEQGWEENPTSGLWWQVIVLLNRIQSGE